MTPMKDFFEGIQSFFEFIMFNNLDWVRQMELENWWMASLVNWIFMIIGFVAAVYWIKQLKLFNDRGEEDKSITSHSYL
jgi:phosphotransferase system  glucose/maltose/N-acetylglucosamine-specific IIC component